MSRNGERRHYELVRDAGHALGTLFQDYGWADEVVYARFARIWVPVMAEQEDATVEETVAGLEEKYEAFSRPWLEQGYRC